MEFVLVLVMLVVVVVEVGLGHSDALHHCTTCGIHAFGQWPENQNKLQNLVNVWLLL